MSEPPQPPPPQPNTATAPPPPILTTPYPTPYHRQLQPQPQHQTLHHHHLPSTSNLREYRKGNWTLEETLILITAKRLDDERRINTAAATTTSRTTAATGELRWKWVENYCWNNGCLRSQNQCNDKWDNLLRDYKKVREYEVSLSSSSSSNNPSYWEMDKNQRKDRNLPSNLILRIYEALNEVVQRKYPSPQTRQPTLSIQSPPMTMSAPPPPPPLLPPPPPGNSGASDSSETDGTRGEEEDESPKIDPESKRQRKAGDIESTIVRSTSVLTQTLINCEEKREKRHREIMEMEKQRLRIEESRNEMNRQGFSSLITSVNNLSNAIHSLISDRRDKG